ncbi:YoaK family protein [Gordonia sp. NPDC003376]
MQTSASLRFALLLTCASGFLDSYTFLVRGGVFANAQTGNVIFFGIDLAGRHWHQALGHLWPIIAFVLGVGVAVHVKTGRLDGILPHPIRATMGVLALILLGVGFVPATAPEWIATIPISFLAAIQIELFRSIGDLNYVSVATTGNLMRLVEAGYTTIIERDPLSRNAFRVYSGVVGIFAVGAVIGAFASHALGVRAAWIPAASLAVTLVLFVVDERRTEPGS